MIFTKTINKPQHNNIHKERYKCKVCYAKFIQCAKINILANRERERERERLHSVDNLFYYFSLMLVEKHSIFLRRDVICRLTKLFLSQYRFLTK